MDEPYQVDNLVPGDENRGDSPTYRILRLFFQPPFPSHRPSFTIKEVSGCMPLRKEGEVEQIVQQLAQDGFLTQDPSKPESYRYNYNCPHVESQVAFEKAVAYEYLPEFPSYDRV